MDPLYVSLLAIFHGQSIENHLKNEADIPTEQKYDFKVNESISDYFNG